MQEESMKSSSGYLLFVAGLAVLALVAWGVYAINSQQDSSMMDGEATEAVMQKDTIDTETMMEEKTVEESESENTDTMMQAPESSTQYIVYSPEAYEAASSKKRVLFFHAAWCPTCKIANEAFMQNAASLPEDVVVFKVDYDTEMELKKKYGITYQHTFVLVDDEGEAVTKWNGGGVEMVTEKVN